MPESIEIPRACAANATGPRWFPRVEQSPETGEILTPAHEIVIACPRPAEKKPEERGPCGALSRVRREHVSDQGEVALFACTKGGCGFKSPLRLLDFADDFWL